MKKFNYSIDENGKEKSTNLAFNMAKPSEITYVIGCHPLTKKVENAKENEPEMEMVDYAGNDPTKFGRGWALAIAGDMCNLLEKYWVKDNPSDWNAERFVNEVLCEHNDIAYEFLFGDKEKKTTGYLDACKSTFQVRSPTN